MRMPTQASPLVRPLGFVTAAVLVLAACGHDTRAQTTASPATATGAGVLAPAQAPPTASPTQAPTADPAMIANLEAFVRAPSFEGLAYAEARAFGPAALPRLRAMLADPAERDNWATIVGVIGAVGGPDASAALTGFIDAQRGRALDGASFRAALSAVTALGYTAHGGEDTALSYLTAAVDACRRGADPAPGPGLRLGRDMLGQHALQALGLSGHPVALATLEAVARDRAWDQRVGPAAEARATHAGVRAQGLAAYLARPRTP